jgi:hypothetical protein
MAGVQRATAVVLSVEVSASLSTPNPSLIEGMLQRFSADKWVVRLEVLPEAGEPFVIERRYSVPKSILGGPRGAARWHPEVGQRLPVLIDPTKPDSVIVDGGPLEK